MAAMEQRTQSQELVAVVRSDQFVEQLALALPETVSPRRFARIAVTAIQQNPDLAKCSRESVAQALLRCAADGLLPDGREAALVKFGDSAAYIPMIAGYRKVAADHGWTLRTRAVHARDEFAYSEEPPELVHRPAPLGEERGQLVAAYAIATHQDGRRLQRVMTGEEIAKRRAKARSKNIWEEWPEQMAEKTAGRDLFGELPLGDLDQERVRRMIDSDRQAEQALADPIRALYGPTEVPASQTLPTDSPHDDGSGTPIGGNGAGPVDAASAGPAATLDEAEDGEWEEAVDLDVDPGVSDETILAAGAVTVPGGVHKGRTLSDVASDEQGGQWFLTQLKRLAPGDRMRPAIETYVQGRLPEIWARYADWKTEQS